MSYSTWHTYGYGFRFSDLKGYTSESIGRLLRLAPDFEKKIQEDFKANGITNPTVKDYEEYDCDYDMGVGHLLREVIMEAEGMLADDESNNARVEMAVNNTRNLLVDLPKTGGIGTVMFTVLGVCGTAAGAVVLAKSKRNDKKAA